MPGYKMKVTEKTICFWAEGKFTIASIEAYISEVEQAEASSGRIYNRFIDLQGISGVNLSFDDLFPLTEYRNEVVKRYGNTCVKVAILAKDPLSFGLGRTYEMMMASANVSVRVFKKRGDAANWLEEQVEALTY